jgi:hypothetical protein
VICRQVTGEVLMLCARGKSQGGVGGDLSAEWKGERGLEPVARALPGASMAAALWFSARNRRGYGGVSGVGMRGEVWRRTRGEGGEWAVPVWKRRGTHAVDHG